MCTVALTIASALGSLYQGYTQQQAANAQAAAAEQNARIASQQAHDAVTRGGIQEGKMRRDLRKLLGKQAANAGASGVTLNSGSITDARLSSIDAMERDIDVNEMNAQRERWGYDVQAVNYMNQASAARAAGSNAWTAGVIGAGTSLLSLVAPKVDDWFSKGVSTGDAYYAERATYGLNSMQDAGKFGAGVDIFDPVREGAVSNWKTPVSQNFTPEAFGLSSASFGAGIDGISGGVQLAGAGANATNVRVPGYAKTYGKKFITWP